MSNTMLKVEAETSTQEFRHPFYADEWNNTELKVDFDLHCQGDSLQSIEIYKDGIKYESAEISVDGKGNIYIQAPINFDGELVIFT